MRQRTPVPSSPWPSPRASGFRRSRRPGLGNEPTARSRFRAGRPPGRAGGLLPGRGLHRHRHAATGRGSGRYLRRAHQQCRRADLGSRLRHPGERRVRRGHRFGRAARATPGFVLLSNTMAAGVSMPALTQVDCGGNCGLEPRLSRCQRLRPGGDRPDPGPDRRSAVFDRARRPGRRRRVVQRRQLRRLPVAHQCRRLSDLELGLRQHQYRGIHQGRVHCLDRGGALGYAAHRRHRGGRPLRRPHHHRPARPGRPGRRQYRLHRRGRNAWRTTGVPTTRSTIRSSSWARLPSPASSRWSAPTPTSAAWRDDVWVTRGTPCIQVAQARLGQSGGILSTEAGFDLREVVAPMGGGAVVGDLAITGYHGPSGGHSRDAFLLLVQPATLAPVFANRFGDHGLNNEAGSLAGADSGRRRSGLHPGRDDRDGLGGHRRSARPLSGENRHQRPNRLLRHLGAGRGQPRAGLVRPLTPTAAQPGAELS